MSVSVFVCYMDCVELDGRCVRKRWERDRERRWRLKESSGRVEGATQKVKKRIKEKDAHTHTMEQGRKHECTS